MSKRVAHTAGRGPACGSCAALQNFSSCQQCGVNDFSAVVLAGGQSSRMGRDKALLEMNGVPMWQRQRDLLAAAGSREIFLSVRPDQKWALDARGYADVIQDAMPLCGPLVGITAALERCSHPWLAVVAVDLPALPARWFRELQQQLAPDVGAVGRRDDRFEPLSAIYPRDFMWLAWDAIGRNEFALQPLLRTAVDRGLIRVREITAAETAWFANWNEPADVPVSHGRG